MRVILTIAFWAVFTSLAFCQSGSGEYALPKGLLIVLPKDGSVKAEWIAPPLTNSQTRKVNLSNQKFRMDKRGAVWLAYNQKFLANLASGMVFSLARPMRDFIFLDDGALFIVSNTSLGFIPPFKKEQISLNDPVLPFQPICALPLVECSIASDGQNRIYVYGYDPAAKNYAVFELLKGFSGWQKVFVSEENISSVCVTADGLYIATGRRIIKMGLSGKDAKIEFAHLSEFVTGVAYQRGIGLFYSTNSGIGLVGEVSLEFMKCPSPQIQIRDSKLYVFLPDSLGVLRFDNIERLISEQVKK